MYDIELSERARLKFNSPLHKTSAPKRKTRQITNEQIASDLGILTKRRDGLALKNVQRSLEELEEHGYLRRWQKYKGENVPLTIKLNFDEGFLRQKREESVTNSDINEQPGSENPSENVHPYNPFLSSLNPSLSSSNPVLSGSNPSLSDHEEEKDLEKELSEEIPDNTKNGFREVKLEKLPDEMELSDYLRVMKERG